MKLDHIMFAANDLDAGIEHVQALTGVRAAAGGSHPGGGTRNALLSFGASQYLEIIAPDPGQTVNGTLGEEIARAEQPFIRTWAAATTDFQPLIDAAETAGYQHHIVDMSRTRPDGVALAWQLLFIHQHPFGMALPFFINWQDSPHPADDAPACCRLRQFSVQLPEAQAMQMFCDSIGLDVEVQSGPVEMRARLDSPHGVVSL